MKYIKTFENHFSDRLTFDQRQIIADIVRGGDLFASTDFDENLEVSFKVNVYNYGGAISEDDDIPRDRLDAIASEIEKGENFGIVENEPQNIEWDIELDV